MMLNTEKPAVIVTSSPLASTTTSPSGSFFKMSLKVEQGKTSSPLSLVLAGMEQRMPVSMSYPVSCRQSGDSVSSSPSSTGREERPRTAREAVATPCAKIARSQVNFMAQSPPWRGV